MTFKSGARIQETSVTTGTGTYTLDGAPTGYQSFSTLGANNVCEYYATDGTDWEEGIGKVLTGPNRLERVLVMESSNSDAAVNWGVGTRTLRNAPIGVFGVPRTTGKSVAGTGTLVLTDAEQRVAILDLSGTLTGNREVEVDATPWVWLVANATTGAFSLTFKVTGGTGIVLEQGRRHVVYCDGVDVRRGAVAGSGSGTGDSEFAPGTLMLFHQAAAPTGWTKQTTHNDKALRVVSGSVSAGGNTAFSSVFGAGKSTSPFTLTINEMPAHAHASPNNGLFATSNTGHVAAGSGVLGNSPSSVTQETGGGQAHSHTLSLDLQYVDVIIAQKA